jgi:hypothetical protein
MRRASRLSGVMVSVLAIGPQVRGFKLIQGHDFQRPSKSTAHLPSVGK